MSTPNTTGLSPDEMYAFLTADGHKHVTARIERIAEGDGPLWLQLGTGSGGWELNVSADRAWALLFGGRVGIELPKNDWRKPLAELRTLLNDPRVIALIEGREALISQG